MQSFVFVPVFGLQIYVLFLQKTDFFAKKEKPDTFAGNVPG